MGVGGPAPAACHPWLGAGEHAPDAAATPARAAACLRGPAGRVRGARAARGVAVAADGRRPLVGPRAALGAGRGRRRGGDPVGGLAPPLPWRADGRRDGRGARRRLCRLGALAGAAQAAPAGRARRRALARDGVAGERPDALPRRGPVAEPHAPAARCAALRARRPAGLLAAGQRGARLPVPRARAAARARRRAGRVDRRDAAGGARPRADRADRLLPLARAAAAEAGAGDRGDAGAGAGRRAAAGERGERRAAVVRLQGVRREPRPRRPGPVQLEPHVRRHHLAARRRRGAARRHPPAVVLEGRRPRRLRRRGVDRHRQRAARHDLAGVRPARRLAGPAAVARHAARDPAADRDRHGDRGRDDARGPRHRPAPSSRAATRGSGARPRRSAAATRTASRPSRRGRTRSSSRRRPRGSTRGIRPS